MIFFWTPPHYWPLSIAGSPGGFAVYVRRIVSKEIVDPLTIRLKTATPYGALPQDLNAVMIVSKNVALKATSADFDSGKAMIGSGPFKFVRWARGDRVELARFDGYWDKPSAWDKVSFRAMPSDPARIGAAGRRRRRDRKRSAGGPRAAAQGSVAAHRADRVLANHFFPPRSVPPEPAVNN